MEWMWPVFKDYVDKEIGRKKTGEPSEDEREAKFFEIVAVCTVTILVQEPWQGSVRFKRLARLAPNETAALYSDPMGWLSERYGGGKFKLNFHDGWNFVATQNFKPGGEQRWDHLPELDDEH